MINASKLIIFWLSLWAVLVTYQYAGNDAKLLNQFTALFQSSTTTAAATNEYNLTINVRPEHARVRIMNIKQKFINGMALKPSTYKVKIDANGYKTRTFSVALKSTDRVLNVNLEAR